MGSGGNESDDIGGNIEVFITTLRHFLLWESLTLNFSDSVRYVTIANEECQCRKWQL